MAAFKQRTMSLRSQILVIMLALGALIISLSAYVLTYERIQSTHTHIERELRTLMTFAQGSLNRSLRFNEHSALEEVMSEVKAHRRVRSAAIFNTAGEEILNPYIKGKSATLMEVFPSGDIQAFQSSFILHELKLEFNKASNSYFAYIPIVSVPEALAGPRFDVVVVEYVVPISWRDAFTMQLPFIVGWVMALLSILILLWVYLNQKVAQPAANLLFNIASVENGRLDRIKPIVGASELMKVDQAFINLVTEREKNEAELIKLSTAIEQSTEGVVITDHNGNIEYVNQALLDNTQYSKDELIGSNPRILSSGKTKQATFDAMWKQLSRGKPWTGELYNRRRDGTEFIELQTITPLKNKQGEITHYVGVRQDISEQKSIQERLNFIAYFDTLTHLPNRASVLDAIKEEIAISRSKGSFGAFLLMNVDRLKMINDGRGFEFGNQVILALSERLERFANGNVQLGHLGADTFCLTVGSNFKSADDAFIYANDLASTVLEECASPLIIDNESLSVTVSVGFRHLDEFDTPEELVRKAETAVHNAKERGGNQSCYYREVDGQQAELVFQLENELHEAIKAQQLRCFLQTQVNEKGELAGAETLVRWEHPERGMVSPGDFISVAERSDLIVEIDRWMLEQALGILSQWQKEQRKLSVSVNISPRHLRRADFVAEVLGALKAAGANPQGLILEVTEGLMVDDLSGSIEKMKVLQGHGIQFAIDDFGTGYSSLSYIRDLPVDEIKIDQSFIRGLPDTEVDVTMVSTIISVAQNLGLRVLAEGIETEDQAEFCKQRQVWGQGYYYDRPCDEATWREKWLS